MSAGRGYFLQGNDQMEEVDELGKQLSIVIGCPVHYPAYGKRLFECECGIIYPLYVVSGGDWETIKQKHTGGY